MNLATSFDFTRKIEESPVAEFLGRFLRCIPSRCLQIDAIFWFDIVHVIRCIHIIHYMKAPILYFKREQLTEVVRQAGEFVRRLVVDPLHGKELAEAIFYEVYPQRFLDTNGDGIGDLPGVIAKLDYIRSIGCDAIWLNPCFESPFGDAGYNRTGSRTPMPWNSENNSGFSTAPARELYLPINPVKNRPTVEAQNKDAGSLLNHIRRLAKLRRHHLNH